MTRNNLHPNDVSFYIIHKRIHSVVVQKAKNYRGYIVDVVGFEGPFLVKPLEIDINSACSENRPEEHVAIDESDLSEHVGHGLFGGDLISLVKVDLSGQDA